MRHKKCWFTFCLIAVMYQAAVTSRAQEVIPPPEVRTTVPITPSASVRPGVEASVDDLYRALRELQSDRSRTVAEVNAAQSRVTHADSSRALPATPLAQLQRQVATERQHDEDRSARLREKLAKLRELVEHGQVCRPTVTPPEHPSPAPASSSDAAQQQSHEAGASQTVPPSGTDATESHAASSPDANATAAPDSHPESHTDSQHNALSAPVSTSSPPESPAADEILRNGVHAVAVLDGPIDRLALANNLYGTGELKLALEIYQKVDRSSLTPNDQLWIEYQIANCHRRLGNRADAERSFRIVTSRNRDSWISQNSRWWLDVETKTAKVQQQLREIQQALTQLQEVPNATPVTP